MVVNEVPRLAVVGGGFCGAAFALHLIRACGRVPLALDIYEPRALLGAGLAYSSEDPEHRINVAAARMAVFAEDPTHFDRWFRETGEAARDPAALVADGRAYPRRAVFGRYVDGLLRTAVKAVPEVALRHLRTRVAEIAPHPAGFRLRAEDGTESAANLVVLSPGHPAPQRLPFVAAEAEAHPRFIADPWRADALAAIRPDDAVLIIGTGLTMADIVASLRARGHAGPIAAVSRRGLTPRPRTTLPVEALGSFDRVPTASAAELLHRVRRAVKAAAAQGRPWECVVDALRQQGMTVWQALSPASRRRFLRHLRPWWDAHRYQIAPQLDQVLIENQVRDKLAIVRATVETLRLHEGRFRAVLLPRGTGGFSREERHFDAVVNCTGPDQGKVIEKNPLLRSLAGRGLLRADPLGLGIAVDQQARVIGSDGRAARGLFVAGPLARGTFGELMGLPQVSTQPERLAQYLADLLGATDLAATA